MAGQTSTARISSTPRARRWGRRAPSPAPTSSTLLVGPSPGTASATRASWASTVGVMAARRALTCSVK